MSAKNYLTASDVSEYMGISIPMAYKIIRRLNDELKPMDTLPYPEKSTEFILSRRPLGFPSAREDVCRYIRMKRPIPGIQNFAIRTGPVRLETR